jgi:hypothetical protein
MANQDQDTPTRPSNKEKAEGERISEWGEGTSAGAGSSNRPQGEMENQGTSDASTVENGGLAGGGTQTPERG